MISSKTLAKLRAWDIAFSRSLVIKLKSFCDAVFEIAVMLSLFATMLAFLFALAPALQILGGLVTILVVIGITARSVNMGHGAMSIIGIVLYAGSWIPYWYFYQSQSFAVQMIPAVICSAGILVWFLAFARSLSPKKHEHRPRRVAELRAMQN